MPKIIVKKPMLVSLGVFLLIAVVFIVFNWRLFAFGSKDQLFLYGDNLSIFNNLFYLFNNFNFIHPFNTFIGQNGMMGSYPMSEPQNSIFYLPLLFCLLIYKLFHFGPIGLYYLLLIVHSLHFIFGSFFIYLICSKLLGLNRKLSLLGALIYLGLGWNANSFGTGTLSYMVGLLPILFYVFLRYLKAPNIRIYLVFIFALSLFFYAGGIINFFFYVWLNFLLIFIAINLFRFAGFVSYQSMKETLQKGVLLFVAAPLGAIIIYAGQLFTTYFVSHDITHGEVNYDYLSFFGSRLYDLIGLIFPKFGLLYFGMQSNPQLLTQFSGANVFYLGIIPLALLIISVIMLKNKGLTPLFGGLAFLNLILSFGGLFFLYDLTYFLPGVSLFRGHYKYLALFGLYVSLLAPLILSLIEEKKVKYLKAFVGLKRFFLGIVGVLAFFAILASLAAFGLGVFQRGSNDASLDKFYHLFLILAACFSGAVFFFSLALLLWHILKNKKGAKAIKIFVGLRRFFLWAIAALVLLAILASFAAFGLGVFQRENALLNGYYNFALTLSAYFSRAVLIFVLSLIALYVFVKNRSWLKYLILIFVILLDLSINYKYAMYYSTPIENLISPELFQGVRGKTIVSSLEKYSQIYNIPEIIGTDPVFVYSAIPNKYLLKYNNFLFVDQVGHPDTNLFLAAGINGLLTEKILEDPAYKLVSSLEINKDNYKKFLAYNANGDIHNNSGDDPGLIGQKLNYYELPPAKKFYFCENYTPLHSEKDIADYLEAREIKPDKPIILADIGDPDVQKATAEPSLEVKAVVLEDRPVYKKIQLDNQKKGLLVAGIPYSGIWEAKVNGAPQIIYRTNYAFLGIKVPPESTVEIYVDQSRPNFFLFVSIFGFLLLAGLWLREIVKKRP